MRIALLAPLPPEQTGIADYAANFRAALQGLDVVVETPLAGVGNDPEAALRRVAEVDWQGIELVHAELGGGRLAEFAALGALRQRFPELPLSATVHDPERLVWRRARLPWPLSLAARLPSPAPQAATVLADPLCLREEQRLAAGMNALITLTETGATHLRRRMRLPPERVHVIAHGNLIIPPRELPPLEPLRLLYFGFIYRGKGIEDLLDALAEVVRENPERAVRLTLAGGSAPEMAFGPGGSYLDELRARIDGLGLGARIDWALDIPAESIPEVIQAHHVMVLPYRESKKLALLGAMRGTSGALSWAAACGRGAITSDARAFAEEVSRGNGAIFPQGDTKALAERLRALCDQPELARTWAENAQNIGLARQWPRTAERFRALFISLRKR
ncbi:MAG: Alpha-D-kanosaminyltransferase [Stenotrophomonas maltophilia]|nr:MAG: Alpha-D-kanosaminyltransferase [Stenotrophomonas maltophilia]